MVGGTNHQSQQASQLAPPSSTAPTTAPEEDELLKKNTDCVYFLASPLTCKKGSECEYRHSDVARVNPRDCWYWLNGNCLNPKCGFRHPPLDGLLGTDASTPKAPSVPQLHTHVTLAMPKQGVACIFFQKGFCLKGHLCPFAHAPPNSVNFNKTVNPVTEPPKMAYSHPEKSNFTQNETVKKPIELLLPQAKQARIGDFIDKKIAPPRQKSSRVKIEVPSNKSNHIVYKANHVLDNNRIMSYKDANEYSREPSPGFDVLVENEREDSEYHHNRDESSRSRDTYNESDLRHRLAKQRRGSDSDSHHVSNRLRGRIKIPRSSISPSRNPSFNQTRLKDRIKRRSSEDNNDKGSRGRQIITYDDDAGTTMFTEPKRLLSEEKRRHTQAADALSFEGPKPLSEILKRKRGSFEDSCKERETICGKKEEYKSVSASEVEKESKRVDVKSSSANYDASEVENEEGLIDEDAMLDQELEAYDHTNGDYDYEQIDGEDYNLDEGEIPDEEYVDEDGEYATKESVPY